VRDVAVALLASHSSFLIGEPLIRLYQLEFASPPCRPHAHLCIDTKSQPIAAFFYIMQKSDLRVRLKKATKESTKCLKTVAWGTCKCVLYTVCAPVICCALLCLPSPRCTRRRRGGSGVVFARPEFPTPRPRALSLPLIEAQPTQKTLHQPQSSFMTKLYVTSLSRQL
jgi:hypothetical protein